MNEKIISLTAASVQNSKPTEPLTGLHLVEQLVLLCSLTELTCLAKTSPKAASYGIVRYQCDLQSEAAV